MVVRANVNFEKRGVVWIESWLWRGYLLSSRNSSNLQFLACSCLSKLKWCIWRIIALFHLCCHYEEILNYKHNTICNIIPFASLRTQKRWVNIRWLLGPQQWFYIKNSDRTTHSGVSPFPISLSLIASHFLSDTDTIEMEWRTVTITLLSSSLIWTDTWWPWSYCSILDLRLGLYIATTLSVHLSCAPYKVTSEVSLLWTIGRLQTYHLHVATLSFR